MDVTVVDDVRALADLWPAWDGLAEATSRPYCSPAWMLAWWRLARPEGAVLRTIVVHEGTRLVGLAPFFAHRAPTGITRYRLLGARCSSHVDLLALPGKESAAARAIAGCLDRVRPRPSSILFDGVRESSPWPRLLSASWAGTSRLRVVTEFGVPAPFIVTDGGGFEGWLAGKSRNFRQSLRRKRRRLEQMGATFGRAAVGDDLERALEDLARLHRLRWDARGGSRVLAPGIERMLLDAGRTLLPLGRFDVWRIEFDGRCISSHLFLSAGAETTYWLGGFDPAWAGYQPALLSLLDAIEGAFGTGYERIDLGTGAQPYKLRFTDDVEHVRWVNAIPNGAIAPLVRLDLLPTRARLAAAGRLSPRAKERIRHAATRVRRSEPRA